MARPRREVDLKEIARLRQKGYGAGKIAQVLGVSKPTIQRIERREWERLRGVGAAASAPGESPNRQPGAGNGTGSVPRVGTPGSVPTATRPPAEVALIRAAMKAARTPEQRRRHDDAQHRLRMDTPYDCSSEQRHNAEKALEAALDAQPNISFDRIVEEVVKELREQIAAAKDEERRRQAWEKERERWIEASEREFQRRWDDEVRHEEWKLRGAGYDKLSALRSVLGHGEGRAKERFSRGLKPRATGENLDKLIDKTIAEAFEDVLGTGAGTDAEVEP